MNSPLMTFRRKLMAAALVPASVFVGLACAVSIVNEYLNYRTESSAQLSAVGGVVAANCAAAVVFEDPKIAEETLAALDTMEQVFSAGLYDKQGALFATYRRKEGDPGLAKSAPRLGARTDHGMLLMALPVELNG